MQRNNVGNCQMYHMQAVADIAMVTFTLSRNEERILKPSNNAQSRKMSSSDYFI